MSLQSFFASSHVFLYRVSGGRIGSTFRGAPVLLLTTTGRKSGKRRTTPVLYAKDGNRLALVASNEGRDYNPSWSLNLRQNPQAEVQIKGEKWPVKAEQANEFEKARLWHALAKIYPFYDDYQSRTKREIPVIILTSSNSANAWLVGTK